MRNYLRYLIVMVIFFLNETQKMVIFLKDNTRIDFCGKKLSIMGNPRMSLGNSKNTNFVSSMKMKQTLFSVCQFYAALASYFRMERKKEVNVVCAKCENVGFMFMFRRKRNCLAKRLWKARIRREHEIRSKGEIILEDHEENGPNCSSCCSLGDEGLLRNAVLKRLKDNQLEMLVEAVESGGAGTSTCVLVPKDLVHEPHLLCCQIWRWPDLKSSAELRQTPACSSASDPIYICCNPYHWSRLSEPESPPPPYTRFINERLKPEDRAPSEAEMIDYELAYHNYFRSSDKFRSSFSTSGEHELKENEWCKLAYWELSQRVGRLYPVQSTAVNVFWTNMQADGLSLETLAHNFSPPESVHRNRNKIGLGITLSLEEDGVWMYNRSEWPVFVNSPSLDRPGCRTFLVYRVPAGHCFRIFYPRSLRPMGSTTYWTSSNSGPVDPNSVRISFAKGWGPKYSRQEITACPTWLEVLLSPCR